MKDPIAELVRKCMECSMDGLVVEIGKKFLETSLVFSLRSGQDDGGEKGKEEEFQQIEHFGAAIIARRSALKE
jgi:hypothetical protein